jgi:excisionase family DNA binding protein
MTISATVLKPKWHTIQEVAVLLGFSVSKTKMLVLQRKIKSVKAGHHRRIMPQWVDDYIQLMIEEGDDE